jgi:hypothetical protein
MLTHRVYFIFQGIFIIHQAPNDGEKDWSIAIPQGIVFFPKKISMLHVREF